MKQVARFSADYTALYLRRHKKLKLSLYLINYRPGKSSRYPLYRRLGGPQSQSGLCGVEQDLVDAVESKRKDAAGVWGK
jgi:hypothetical protein